MKAGKFIKLKTTEGQSIYVKPDAVGALEVVPASVRAEGHIKVFVSGYKFLISAEEEELLKQLNEGE